MITPKQHFERLEATLADIMKRVKGVKVELPLPKSQAKWNDIGNDWYVERNLDQWDLIFFNDERWEELGRETYASDDSLLFAIVSMELGHAKGDEHRLEIMEQISPAWRTREERAQKRLKR